MWCSSAQLVISDLSNWALEQHILDYSDECFGSFVWKVIESKDHTTSVEVQRHFGFLVTAWIKVGTPSLEQLNSVSKILNRNVHDAGIDKERGAWKKYYLDKLKEREDNGECSFSRMKDRVARDSEECKADLKHTQSDAVEKCQAEMGHAIAHLAEDTLVNITSTVSRNARANLETFINDELAPRERGC